MVNWRSFAATILCSKNVGSAEERNTRLKLWMVPWRWSIIGVVQDTLREVDVAGNTTTSRGGPKDKIINKQFF